jgi:two-component system, cell cycle sensor histidine kinase and response regulator CckA
MDEVMEEHEKTKTESLIETVNGRRPLSPAESVGEKPRVRKSDDAAPLAFLPRKPSHDGREAWLKAEELICDISTRLSESSPQDIRGAIQNILGAVGSFIGCDNVHLVLFDDGKAGAETSVSWHDGTRGYHSGVLSLLPSDWLKQKLSCSAMCHIAYRSSLPEESTDIREAWENSGIRSLLAIPLVVNEALSGMIGLFSFQIDRAWAESDVITLRLAGEMLASVLTRKRTEETLRVHEARTNSLFSVVPDTILWIGAQGTILDLKSPELETVFGRQTISPGMSLVHLDVPAEIAETLTKAAQDCISTGQRQTIVLQWPAYDNWHRIQANLARSGKGEAVCAIREVPQSNNPHREEGLGGFFTAMAHQSMVGLYLLQDNIFRHVNNHFAETLGYTIEEIIGNKKPEDLAYEEDRVLVRDNLEKRLSGEVDSTHYEFRAQKKNGETVDVEVCGVRTIYRNQPAIVGTLLNITDRKRLETQLIQSERMKAIGPLSGGIAHDFNNILMAIQGYTSLMLHLLHPSHAHYNKLKGIEELVSSGSDLTRQLLSFASGGTYQVRPTDLNEIVRKTSNMFARTKKEVSIQSQYETGCPVVDVDAGQMEQVLLNLYVNAWQAMPSGGTLILETEIVVPKKQLVVAYSLKPGKHARITVTDTGIGMDEKTKERIFEPFFTTKKRGRGTGLGLASAYNIIKGHNGAITVESEKGKGTTFYIYLPLSRKAVEKTEIVQQSVLKGRETILLVDDEETVITVNKDMLEALGYSVLVARSGREALDVYQKNVNTVDLVILDVIMPDMGGEETFAALAKINPLVAVVLSSGYSLEGPMRKIMSHGCKAFIQKPFTINTLSQKLREVLGEIP